MLIPTLPSYWCSYNCQMPNLTLYHHWFPSFAEYPSLCKYSWHWDYLATIFLFWLRSFAVLGWYNYLFVLAGVDWRKTSAKVLSIFLYIRRRLIGSWIMGSLSYWDQIYLIWGIQNYHFLPNLCLVDLLIGINLLLESDSLCPKVILLSVAHCICFVSNL